MRKKESIWSKYIHPAASANVIQWETNLRYGKTLNSIISTCNSTELGFLACAVLCALKLQLYKLKTEQKLTGGISTPSWFTNLEYSSHSLIEPL